MFLDTILENVHLQPFIGYSRLITNHLVSLYRYECCIINCYVCSIAIVQHSLICIIYLILYCYVCKSDESNVIVDVCVFYE